MKQVILPEERLLNLIRGSRHKRPSRGEGMPASAVKPRPRTRKRFNVRDHLTLRSLRSAAWVTLIFSFVYLFAALSGLRAPRSAPRQVRSTPKEGANAPLGTGIGVKPAEFYLQGVEGRDIFTAPAALADGSAHVAAREVLKDIHVVGIITGDDSQAVIEDRKLEKTYYVTKGQVVNGLRIEDIQAGKIIVNCQGQRFELYL